MIRDPPPPPPPSPPPPPYRLASPPSTKTYYSPARRLARQNGVRSSPAERCQRVSAFRDDAVGNSGRGTRWQPAACSRWVLPRKTFVKYFGLRLDWQRWFREFWKIATNVATFGHSAHAFPTRGLTRKRENAPTVFAPSALQDLALVRWDRQSAAKTTIVPLARRAQRREWGRPYLKIPAPHRFAGALDPHPLSAQETVWAVYAPRAKDHVRLPAPCRPTKASTLYRLLRGVGRPVSCYTRPEWRRRARPRAAVIRLHREALRSERYSGRGHEGAL
jgi:hypothetical protein